MSENEITEVEEDNMSGNETKEEDLELRVSRFHQDGSVDCIYMCNKCGTKFKVLSGATSVPRCPNELCGQEDVVALRDLVWGGEQAVEEMIQRLGEEVVEVEALSTQTPKELDNFLRNKFFNLDARGASIEEFIDFQKEANNLVKDFRLDILRQSEIVTQERACLIREHEQRLADNEAKQAELDANMSSLWWSNTTQERIARKITELELLETDYVALNKEELEVELRSMIQDRMVTYDTESLKAKVKEAKEVLYQQRLAAPDVEMLEDTEDRSGVFTDDDYEPKWLLNLTDTNLSITGVSGKCLCVPADLPPSLLTKEEYEEFAESPDGSMLIIRNKMVLLNADEFIKHQPAYSLFGV